MLKIEKLSKITAHVTFVIIFIFFSTLQAKNPENYNKADNISDYFSGILLLNQSKYDQSYKYLRKLEGLQTTHSEFSNKYLYSLVNSGNFNKAFNFAKKLERDGNESFEGDLVIGIYYLNNSQFDLSTNYFLKASKKPSKSLLDSFIISSLYNWSRLHNSDIEESKSELSKLDNRFENLKKIQRVFLNCFYNTKNTNLLFNELVSNEDINFSRYNFFYVKYLNSIGNKNEIEKIFNNSLKKYPRNLLINQLRIDLKKSNKSDLKFDCKNVKHVSAEILYLTANALSVQSVYSLSNFYLNLSKYLNKDFYAFNTLLAENFYSIEDYKSSKEIYKKLVSYGEAFKWFSNQQIARILVKEKNKAQSLSLLKKSFNQLHNKGVYETYDYAEFLKNNEEFEDAIKYYTDVLNRISESHPLFPQANDGRGVAYERIGDWEKAEKDLLVSLEVSPDQAYVINYLAYSWIEQGIKINKSLEMLKKANKLKSNDPYIIDSLGWALFKLKRYVESKEYLQIAVKLMPADPIVNDHFGDVLWKNGNEIQARYYWKYVLGLETAERDLKDKIKHKLIKGL